MAGRRLGVLVLLAASSLVLVACGSGAVAGQPGESGSSEEPPPPTEQPATEETALDPSQYDYVLLVEYRFGDEEVVLDEGTMLFRGPITVGADGRLSVQGQAELEGEFRCPNKDFHSEQEFIGPGEYTAQFPFTVSGEILSLEEVEEVPLVDLDGREVGGVVLRVTFPDVSSMPEAQLKGMDTGQCIRGWEEPKGPTFAAGLSAMLKGDFGEDFNQLVDVVLFDSGTAARYLDTLNPEVIKTAVLCLAKPGEACDL